LEAMAALYLEEKDPVKKAQRAKRQSKLSSRRVVTGKRTPLPASIKHEVNLRDSGRCVQIDPQGNRCTQK